MCTSNVKTLKIMSPSKCFQSTRCQTTHWASCSWYHTTAIPRSSSHLEPSISLSDLNEVVTVSNRRWWSFSWTEIYMPCQHYCQPTPSLPRSLSSFTKSTTRLLSSLPSTMHRSFIGSSFIFICGVANRHHIQLLCPSSSCVAYWRKVYIEGIWAA